MLLDLISLWGGLELIKFLWHIPYFIEILASFQNLFLLFLYICGFNLIFENYNLWVAFKLRISLVRCIGSGILAWFFYLFTPYLGPILPQARKEIFMLLVAILVPITLGRWGYVKFLTNNYYLSKRVLLISRENVSDRMAEELAVIDPHQHIVAVFDENAGRCRSFLRKIRIIRNFDVLERYVALWNIDDIVINNSVDIKNLSPFFIKCIQMGIRVRTYPSLIEEEMEKLPLDLIHEDFYNRFLTNRNNNNQLYLLLNRLLNILFAGVGLVILGLLIPFIYIGNRIANKGKVFYTQERVGQYGECFKIIKLRTMVTNAEENGVQFAGKKDNRITPFGELLRKTRLDELPQLWNILKGDMALIGPRPERPFFVRQIEKESNLYAIRHVIRPGLTGWAQVKYRYGDNLQDSMEKLKYDLYYIKHRGLILDIRIIFKTISTVLFMRGR